MAVHRKVTMFQQMDSAATSSPTTPVAPPSGRPAGHRPPPGSGRRAPPPRSSVRPPPRRPPPSVSGTTDSEPPKLPKAMTSPGLSSIRPISSRKSKFERSDDSAAYDPGAFPPPASLSQSQTVPAISEGLPPSSSKPTTIQLSAGSTGKSATSRMTKRMGGGATPTGKGPAVPKKRSSIVLRRFGLAKDDSSAPSATKTKSSPAQPLDKKYDRMKDPEIATAVHRRRTVAVADPMQAGLDATFSGGTDSLFSMSSAISSVVRRTPTKSALKNPTLKMGDLKNLEKTLVDPLLQQMNAGSSCLHEFTAVLRSFSKQQKEQSEKYLKMFEKSREGYFKMMDVLPDFTFAVSLIHNLLEETVKHQNAFARFIEDGVLPIMDNLDKDCSSEYKEIISAKKREEKMLRERTSALTKLKSQAASAAAKAADRDGDLPSTALSSTFSAGASGVGDYSDGSGGGKAGLSALKKFGQSTMKFGSSKSESGEQLREKAESLKLQFEKAVKDYNTQLEMYNSGYDSHKLRLMNLEHFRISSATAVFKKLVQKQKDLNNDKIIRDLHADILKKSETMDAIQVLESYLANVIAIHGEYHPQLNESTDLGVEFRDPFYSLKEAMDITIEEDSRAKIPFIVPFLCDKVRELNGFTTEGIFRKSPGHKDLKVLKHSIRTKDVSGMNQFDNPHLYAACLKDWCRNLKQPLIPEMYYDFCVSMAKSSKLDKGQFEVFFSQLPAFNRDTLKYLVVFLRELAQPSFIESTKMNVENLAIVFGPTLLRNDHLDPTALMMNAAAEKDFVVALLEKAGV